MLNTWWACETGPGQTWVIMVGNLSMYGSFNNFQNIITLSEFNEDWSYDPVTSQSIYHAEILVDTFAVEYFWGVDSLNTSTQSPIQAESIFSIYPNPSKGYVRLNLNSIIDQSINIRVINTLGKEVHHEQIDSSLASSNTIETSNWETGMYTIIIESEGKQYYQKLIKL